MVQEILEDNKNGNAIFDFKDISSFKVKVMSADPKPENDTESGARDTENDTENIIAVGNMSEKNVGEVSEKNEAENMGRDTEDEAENSKSGAENGADSIEKKVVQKVVQKTIKMVQKTVQKN